MTKFHMDYPKIMDVILSLNSESVYFFVIQPLHTFKNGI